jgi:hypothetical protein
MNREEILKHIKEQSGNYWSIAKKLQQPYREVCEMIDNDPELKDALEWAQREFLDYVMSGIMKNAKLQDAESQRFFYKIMQDRRSEDTITKTPEFPIFNIVRSNHGGEDEDVSAK